jgi:alpha-tubulin suppressor-like RCC1 family protein
MEASTSNIEEWVVDYREFIIATEYDAFGLTRSGCLIHNPLANSMIELPDEQHRFQQIAASDNFFLGLTKKGEVIYWGRHHYAHPDGKTRPIKVEPYQGKCRFTQVACSSTTCAAIDDNGRLYFWGNNVNNRLRLNNIFEKEYCVYIPVLFSTGLLFSSIAVGNDHRIGITSKSRTR